MDALVTKAYCLAHPVEIVRLFGAGAWLRALLSRRRTLLAIVAERDRHHRVPLPGAPGRAYCVSALIEEAVAAFYRRAARRFRHIPEAAALFDHLAEEEREHAHLMIVCLHAARLPEAGGYVPTVGDPEVRELLARLRALRRGVETMTLEEALAAAEALERGEANVIFGRLLEQVGAPQAAFLRARLAEVEDHTEYVPRRIAELRRGIGLDGAA
ncbi:hypothetical protein [Inmirania thermothiophila]|uniref:Rubrerythrin n=1 Tax=Inmirania thermothiophila TaxID=1750597 RepID=A0A3N1Y311_9GAMM|nr:hypothetical protein [Inmirania thermothiophila]ROR32898.1 rubrerythrin [Inmirania thermothiophila]